MSFLNQLINGLHVGSIYALIALGYTMVYGIVKLINFAHGDIIMVGAYISLLLLTALGSALWNTVLVCAGRALGHAWSSIGAFMDTYAVLLWGALGLLCAIWLWRRKKRSIRHRHAPWKKQG